ncbi:CLUMA_CG014181, isoform A [Clunio marinus]|uniref:CLUMA_CG014181, isoform A n=1 Tax=Clunio marinus TaxID=568069 RepID=A0A1J1IRK4_9DIPT|nr:CLUMA_CG014181, isoform A [Clunio marinus]
MGTTVSSPSGGSEIYDRQTFPRSEKKIVMQKANTLERNDNRNTNNGNQENSRMLFLMYLINRTWNVVVDGKGGKRDDDLNKTRFLEEAEGKQDDEYSCVYGSECSGCSCGYCEDENCRINGNYSICER